MAINTGGPAFPSVGEGFGNPLYSAGGMTLRDYFAGQALAGWMVDTGGADLSQPNVHAAAATNCYGFADAMLAERAKEPK